MLNLTSSQMEFLIRFNDDMSTQEIIEDLMLMYSSYVDDMSNPEKFTIDKDTFLDIQQKLFTIQRVLELVSIITDATTALRKVS